MFMSKDSSSTSIRACSWSVLVLAVDYPRRSSGRSTAIVCMSCKVVSKRRSGFCGRRRVCSKGSREGISLAGEKAETLSH